MPAACRTCPCRKRLDARGLSPGCHNEIVTAIYALVKTKMSQPGSESIQASQGGSAVLLVEALAAGVYEAGRMDLVTRKRRAFNPLRALCHR
jgi:hypothetical protein